MFLKKEHNMVNGCFPVIYPWMKNEVFHWLEPSKAMVSIASLNKQQRKRTIHKVLKFRGLTFLDCGAFQLTHKPLDWNKNYQYRERLIRDYRNLKPEIASALDIPYTFKKKIHFEAIKWSLKNYVFMRDELDDSILLVPGFCVFSNKAIEFLSKETRTVIGEPKIIALGGLVQVMRTVSKAPENGKILLRIVHQFCKAFPESRVHVYGLGEHRWYMLIRLLGASSSDYASYVGISGKGGILLPGLPPKYILKKVSINKGSKTVYYTRSDDKLIRGRDLLLLFQCECPICKEVGPISLEFDRDYRIVHNLHVLLTETKIVDQFCEDGDYTGLKRFIKQRLIQKGNSGLETIAKYALKLFQE